LPSIVADFLQQLTMAREEKRPYVYFVATYGTSPGQTGRFAAEILQKRGWQLTASYSIKFPDTWTPMFDLSDPVQVARLNDEAEPQIDAVITHLKNEDAGNYMTRQVPLLAARAFYRLEYDRIRQTKHFSVKDDCIGCGLCAKGCPAGALEMRAGRPAWTKDACVMCLSCLHHCPKFAIQYGKRTEKHGQYRHPLYKK
ncbi:MAG: EFR1 family ferrodoxin, partial [Peptococcaceae bacterium]|nr:EFR1 family ferrodoxin [Peptococcaceae bacterium]